MTEFTENPALPEEINSSLETQPPSPDVEDSPIEAVSKSPTLQTSNDPPLQHYEGVAVDLLIKECSLKSDDIQCLVGEKLPSSNSDENYGSYNPTRGSQLSETQNQLAHEKPWIQTVRGTSTTLLDNDSGAKTLDPATMEAWVADGSDDSLQNRPEEDMKQLLSLGEEESDMEEFKEVEIPQNHCDEAKNDLIDLLTGDDNASEESNACPEPIISIKSGQESVGEKACEQIKSETLTPTQNENSNKESTDYLNGPMNQQHLSTNVEENSTAENEERTKDSSIDVVDENVEPTVEVNTLHQKIYNNAENNCFKVDCQHHVDCIESGISKTSTDYKIENTPNETNPINPNEIFTKCNRRAIDNIEIVDEDQMNPSKFDSIPQMQDIIQDKFKNLEENVERTASTTTIDKDISSNTLREDCSIQKVEDTFGKQEEKVDETDQQSTNTDPSLKAKKEIQTKYQQDLEGIIFPQLEESREESKENDKEIEVTHACKTKKRVTFADEKKELKRHFLSMEPMIEKHDLGIEEAQETQPDLSTALRFMTEVYPNRDEEDALSDGATTESIPSRSRKDSPTAHGVHEELKMMQIDDKSIQILKNSITRSPKRMDNQGTIIKQDFKTTEKSNSKILKFCKSFKKKIGKIL